MKRNWFVLINQVSELPTLDFQNLFPHLIERKIFFLIYNQIYKLFQKTINKRKINFILLNQLLVGYSSKLRAILLQKNDKRNIRNNNDRIIIVNENPKIIANASTN